MKIELVSLIPGIFDNVFSESVLGAAIKAGVLDVAVHSFRLYGDGRHLTVDDAPFGGGPGMVLKYKPLVSCLQDLRKQAPSAPVIGLTPRGIHFSQQIAKELAVLPRIILVCGRYEGFDERILPEFDLQLSIGDYVLTGGEVAAMTVVDSVSRMIPGTVGKMESVEQDSFFEGQLDHPQYTRPASLDSQRVPKLLQNGNHAQIEDWRRERAFVLTAMKRPDLFAKLNISDTDRKRIQRAMQSV